MPTSSELLPTSVDELSEALRDTAGPEAATVTVRGGGSKSGWGAPTSPADITIGTGRLDRVVEHAAGDLVVTAQAGVPLAELQRAVGQARQWLALDPPEPGATVGGVVASAVSGPRRLRYGTPRDLLIGLTVVLADGTVARSGGKVVKNVAGYDLGKLFTGSFGTLGVIVECTFRLHPVPAATRVVRAVVPDVARAVRAVGDSGCVPSAVEYDGRTLTVVLETIEPGAAAQAERVAAALGGEAGEAAEVGERVPPQFGARPWRDGQIGLKLTHRLGALNEVLGTVRAVLPGAAIAAHAGSGVLWAGYAGDGSEVEPLRAAVSAHDGQVVVVHAPVEVKRAVDVWGPVRGLEVMRRIKERFDPVGRMAPGSFVGGI